MPVRLFRLGGDHHPGRIAVQSMHNTRALDAADPLQAIAAMKQQGIDQRAIGRTGSRMNHHAHRLVDHDQLVVLVEDIERDILRMRLGIFRGWGNKDDCLARL
jgi:4-hydroxy-3-methylbut-2-en-1-yl diphosphate synthase IspG/GcpE